MRSERQIRDGAFTLVEVMIALVIMAMSLTAASICLRMGVEQYDSARSTGYATQVLQNEAERLRLLSWSQVGDLPSKARFSQEDSQDGKFSFWRVVENYDGASDIKRLWLIAEWEGAKGGTKELRLTFNYARSGTYDYYYGSGS